MLDTGVTEGERLCALLVRKFVGQASWPQIESEIDFTAAARDWTRSFQEILAVNLTGRIVRGGLSLYEECSTAGSDFDAFFEEFLAGMLTIPRRDLPELVRFSRRAVDAGRRSLSDGEAKRIKQQAATADARCYMCGERLLFEPPFPAGDEHLRYTADHLWPQAYGGDSITENMLPACASCNHAKKQGFATWAMTDFQSLNLGLRPSERALGTISGHHRFALHYRAAQRYARETRCSLKTAFQTIGPWTTISLIDGDDVGHFFNLRNHRVEV